MTPMLRLYHWLVRADRSGQDVAAQRTTARNALRQVAAGALQEIGDQVVNAKTVLPWLFASLGAPSALIGLLVPIRESGSMLPQAALTPWVRRVRARRHVWMAGATGQAVAVALMAWGAAALDGFEAGVAILVALSIFALARSLTSLSGKDVMGRTVPKGERGQISGIGTVISGVVAVSLGLGLLALGGDGVSPRVLAMLLGIAALAWLFAAAVFNGVREPLAMAKRSAANPPATNNADAAAAGGGVAAGGGAAAGAGAAAGDADETPASGEGGGWLRRSWRLLADDAPFRRFVLARTLLLVSALSPPFVVALGASATGLGLAGLGPFVAAQGVASLVGGRWFGRLADRSSKRLMVRGAAIASFVVLLFLAALAVPALRAQAWLYPLVYLLLVLTHTAVRVARKTYVVDMAEGDRRTAYVAVANTTMGALLLVVGAISGGLATLGNDIALGFLALLGLAGVLVARRLPDVSRAA